MRILILAFYFVGLALAADPPATPAPAPAAATAPSTPAPAVASPMPQMRPLSGEDAERFAKWAALDKAADAEKKAADAEKAATNAERLARISRLCKDVGFPDDEQCGINWGSRVVVYTPRSPVPNGPITSPASAAPSPAPSK